MPELVAVEGAAGPEFVAALQRIWDAGDAVLPVDDRLPPVARARLYDALRPTRIGSRRAGGRPVAPGDALVVATSGTTGEPKGVVLTHAAVEASARATSARLEVDPARDAWMCCIPVAHAGGLGVVTRALVTGTDLHVRAGFDAAWVAGTASLIADAGKRPLISLVATALARIDAAPFRCILLGGDRPPAQRAANVVVTYGMTETGGGCVYDGVPLDGVEVAVRDGEIFIRTEMLGRAYRTADDDVALTDDGWFATGDGGQVDDAGRVVVEGRLADVIVTGGEKVWPGPVEETIARHPAVDAVAVIGRPDPDWGQRVVAVVQAHDAVSLPELRDLVKQTLPPWAAPRELELVDELPRTPTGKLIRGSASRRRPRSSDR